MGAQVLVVGGDLRSRKLVDILREADIEVDSLLLGEANVDTENVLLNADTVILPANHMDGAIKGEGSIEQADVAYWLKEDAVLFCGKADDELKELAQEYGFALVEFLSDERFQVYNAYLTAEGTMQSAIQHTQGSMINAHCAIVGSGRIADALLHLLRPFTNNIRVVARNEGYLEKIWMQGCVTYPLSDMEWGLFGADYVFNTVPAQNIKASDLAGLKEGSLYMELASAPGGCKPAECPEGCRHIYENGIPGRISPLAAARAMAECIYRHTGVM